jgi:hypothetical protein
MTTMQKLSAMTTVAALVMTASVAVAAPVPARITEQGRLFQAGTSTPVTGTVAMTFAVYAAPTGGTALWSESFTVTLDDGYFSVQLGSSTAFPGTLWDGSVRYIGVKVGTDAEMTPREEVASVPYALVANDVTGAIHPASVTIGTKMVIDGTGKWVGDTTGLAGPAGPAGPAGAKGDTGATGLTGPAGPAGPAGATGPKGDTGSTGATGAQGLQGIQGPKGDKGDTGSTGLQGVQGPPGVPCTGCVTRASLASGAVGLNFMQVESTLQQVAGGGVVEANYGCPAGFTLIGGGCRLNQGVASMQRSVAFQNAWYCQMSGNGAAYNFTIVAECLALLP